MKDNILIPWPKAADPQKLMDEQIAEYVRDAYQVEMMRIENRQLRSERAQQLSHVDDRLQNIIPALKG